jgi:hypothetical protein
MDMKKLLELHTAFNTLEEFENQLSTMTEDYCPSVRDIKDMLSDIKKYQKQKTKQKLKD